MASQPCPICKKPSMAKYRPFCSDRCSKIDLAHWLGEQYSLPAEDPLEGVEEALDEVQRNSFQKL